MDGHAGGRGRDGGASAVGRGHGKIIGVGIPGDLLYDPELDVRRWTAAAGAEYREIESPKGHDGFLLETEQVSSLVGEVLSKTPELQLKTTCRELSAERLVASG
jgi:homoserine O-acetyltransferase